MKHPYEAYTWMKHLNTELLWLASGQADKDIFNFLNCNITSLQLKYSQKAKQFLFLFININLLFTSKKSSKKKRETIGQL